MVFDAKKHHRRSIRLRGYDYSRGGAYFVTLCTRNREWVFGAIINGRMVLNECGRAVVEEWEKTERMRTRVFLDAFVVMPNHFHGIIVFNPCRGDLPVALYKRIEPFNAEKDGLWPGPGAGCGDEWGKPGDRQVAPTNEFPAPEIPRGPPSRSLGAIMAGFKSACTVRFNRIHGTTGMKLWQRNYWERVIRNEGELNHFRQYIRDNPARWQDDPLHDHGMIST